ncbi:MAG: threonine aldolase [Planctomycetes bacterium]|nr:threonine aldolase [Planctomycetota bacterium]
MGRASYIAWGWRRDTLVPMPGFRSDNNAGLCPEALEALIAANDGSHQLGYGDDEFTARAAEAFAAIFGGDVDVTFVATGTAANVLGIAALAEPWQQVICHRHSHYNDDESTAPERITHCRTVAVDTTPDKVVPRDINFAATNARGDVHEPQPGVVTVSNSTEFGTVYTPEEMRALGAAARAAGYRLHVDGARFANAVASLGCDPRALTLDAGVDAMSFGGTKNGLAFGEAIVLFPGGDDAATERARRTLPYHRKGTGHLLSKHRYVSAPFAAMLAGGAWLTHAGHANEMASRLGRGLAAIGLEPAFPVEANAVFVRLDERLDAALRAAGHGYYPFGDHADRLFRLMCSFDTSADAIDAFLADVRSATS